MHDRQKPLATGAQSVPKQCNDASWVCERCLPAAAEQHLPHAQQRLGPPAAWTHLLQAGRVCQVALDHLCTGSPQLLRSRGFLVACEAPDLEAASIKQCLQARTALLHCCRLQMGIVAPCITRLTLVTLPPWAPVAPTTSTILIGAMCVLDCQDHDLQHSDEGSTSLQEGPTSFKKCWALTSEK